jgi:amino acid transporter
MCEEVEHPATQVPKALVGTVALNTICGLVFLIPLVFVLPDQTELFNLLSGQPLPTIIKQSVGSSGAAIGLLIPLLVLGLICGIGCTTAASRATWAFSRDGAIPGFKWWKVVNVKLDVPLNAMMLSMAVQLILGLIYFGAPVAFNAFSGVGVICLTLSYAIPIFISLIRGRKQVKDGAFHLGALGTFCNVVALGKSFLSSEYSRLNPQLTFASLVCARHSALFHAYYHPGHSPAYELRLRRLCRVLLYLDYLVLCLGQEEL